MSLVPRIPRLGPLLAFLMLAAVAEARHAQVQQLIDDMKKARSTLMRLSDQVRYPGDHTRRTFLHEKEEDYAKAMKVVGDFRTAHETFLGLPMIFFLEDFEAMDEFKALTKWAQKTSIATTSNWQPLKPPQNVERILYHPGWLEEDD